MILAVHLLGELAVMVGASTVERWTSRNRSLFAYLLTHRDPWPTRERLTGVFWPDASPQSARNNLNVTIHGLRRTLRRATDQPIVVFTHGRYRIHPDVQLWLDTDELGQHAEAGRKYEEAGDRSAAINEYEQALSLDRGDFLADDLADEWPVLIRETLRLNLLGLLDRLSALYYGDGRYAACATLCLRIVARDPCREDTHRRLMRCYSRQGQQHLAILQYGACLRALRAELGIEPAPTTRALAAQIRHHHEV